MSAEAPKLTRRELLERATKAGLLIAAGTQLPDNKPKRPLFDRLTPEAYGVNLMPWTAKWLGLDEIETAKEILDKPFEDARISLRLTDVIKRKEDFGKWKTWDFDMADHLMEEASKRGKRIHFQFGFFKSLGYPEVHMGWLMDEFPKLRMKGAKLDENPELQNMALDYTYYVARHFLPTYSNIETVQVENEPFSQNLAVSNYRYISPEFNNREIELVRSLDPKRNTPDRRLILQNVPFDTREAVIPTITNPNIDLIGLNVYNNADAKFNSALWAAVYGFSSLARLNGKKTIISEYQSGPWLQDDKTPKYDFSWERFVGGLDGLKRFKTLLYDLEIQFYLAKHGDEYSRLLLSKLS